MFWLWCIVTKLINFVDFSIVYCIAIYFRSMPEDGQIVPLRHNVPLIILIFFLPETIKKFTNLMSLVISMVSVSVSLSSPIFLSQLSVPL